MKRARVVSTEKGVLALVGRGKIGWYVKLATLYIKGGMTYCSWAVEWIGG